MADIKKYLGGSPSTLNQLNISVVLDRIRRQNSITKSDLAKNLNLSLPTISRIVNTLVEKDYVIEAGFGKSSGGKKPRILKFNSRKAFVVGIAIDINFIEIILADLSGNERKYIHKEFLSNKDPDTMIETIIEYINKSMEESNIDNKELEVISLGIPGMVEKDTNLVKLIPTIPIWEGINLKKILTNKIGKEVLIDNMNNMSLLGERWKGKANGYNNVVFVGVGTGIGCGILINGKIFRGFNGSAGEVGYMFIDRNMDKIISNPQGQFEYLASEIALKKEICKMCLRENICMKNSDEHIIDLLGETKYFKYILGILDNFAYGIANLITILNPELVIVEGSIFKKSEKAFEYLVKKVKELSKFKTKITISSLGKKAISIGAVIHGLKYLDKKIISPLFL